MSSKVRYNPDDSSDSELANTAIMLVYLLLGRRAVRVLVDKLRQSDPILPKEFETKEIL